jgi:uncharacterized protein YjiS (DUF1127 family)
VNFASPRLTGIRLAAFVAYAKFRATRLVRAKLNHAFAPSCHGLHMSDGWSEPFGDGGPRNGVVMASVKDSRLAAGGERNGPRRTWLLGLVLAACARVELWCDRARERRTLAQLTDRELRDAGLNRYEAQEECRKPFWRA